ncbi:MAG: hypothetical protein ACK4J0_01335 [Candidatus Anstonellaceae archaeon]
MLRKNKENGRGIQIIAFFLLIFLFLVGCFQQEIKECERYNGTEKMECIRHYAIISQNPERCYQIKDMSLRSDCLLKSTDQKEAEKLKAQIEFSKRIEEEEKIKRQEEREALTLIETQIKRCMDETLKSRDACLLDIARAGDEIAICDEIVGEEYRRQCITNIAIKKKSLSECKKLKQEADKQLCLFYAG